MLILSDWPSEQTPEQVPNKFEKINQNIIDIILAIGGNECSIKEIMEQLGLKHRPNFLKLYLTPAIDGGLVKTLYPDSSRHPRQKYLLTSKGQMLSSQLKEK